MGWGFDQRLGTLPLFFIVFGLLGFVAGVRVMLRTADAASKRDDAVPRASGAGSDGGA